MEDNPAGESGSQKTIRRVRKRASQACQHCRRRKIKCNVADYGPPCHVCESAAIECVVLESKRSRKYRLQRRKLTGLVSLPSRIAHPGSPDTTKGTPSPSEDNKSDQRTGRYDTEQQNWQDLPASYTKSYPMGPADTSASSLIHLEKVYESPGTSIQTPRQRPQVLKLPPYIRPMRTNIRLDDFEFLAHQGAFELPAVELRDQLLRCFVMYVYPYMPIVDLQDFLDALDGNECVPRLSLTLFHAIMFSGTAFVDLQLLLGAGHKDRRAARGQYFRKLKLLYDFEWDLDQISLIQSLLLANYWYVSENEQKGPWHWIGICVSIATDSGLNQEVTYRHLDPKTCRLWRRIWWSCIARDRIILASMRRPLRVKDEDINLSPLTLNDFDTGSISTSIRVLQDCPFLQNRIVKQNLAEMCIAQLGILLRTGEIFKSLYDLHVPNGSPITEPTILYKPRTFLVSQIQVSTLQQHLDEWVRALPASCRLSPEVDSLHHDQLIDRVLFLHKSVLRMIYLTAIEHLNRPQMLTAKLDALNAPSKMHEAAEQISEMFQRLQERDLVKFLPPLSVGFILFSLPTFLARLEANGQSSRGVPSRQFRHGIQALWQLRDVWHIADYAYGLVAQMVTKSRTAPRDRNKDSLPSEIDTNDSRSAPVEASPTFTLPRTDSDLSQRLESDPMLYGWTNSFFDDQALEAGCVFSQFTSLDEFENDFLELN